MNDIEEMPEEVLLDAWYLTYGSQEVRFPLIRGADSRRVLLSTPLMTAMWKNRHRAMYTPGASMDTTRHRFIEYRGENREWVLYTHMMGTVVASVKVLHRGV